MRTMDRTGWADTAPKVTALAENKTSARRAGRLNQTGHVTL
jgi:hypothetical protein